MKMHPRQIKLTPAQDAVLSQILGKTGETYSNFLRRLLVNEASTHGMTFPQDTPSNDISHARAKRWKS